jgi:hypothetical protein
MDVEHTSLLNKTILGGVEMSDHIKINKDTSQTLWRLWGQWTSEEAAKAGCIGGLKSRRGPAKKTKDHTA